MLRAQPRDLRMGWRSVRQ